MKATQRLHDVGQSVLDRATPAPATGVARGAYLLIEAGGVPPEVILIATGSEVSLALEALQRLVADGIRSRVVSMPSWEVVDVQPQRYHDGVLPPKVHTRVNIEGAAPFRWGRYVGRGGATIGVNRFGAPAPGPGVSRGFGCTADHVVETTRAVLAR